MTLTRRSLLAAIAGLPVVGGLAKAEESEVLIDDTGWLIHECGCYKPPGSFCDCGESEPLAYYRKNPDSSGYLTYHPPVGEDGVGAWYDDAAGTIDPTEPFAWVAHQNTYRPEEGAR